VTWFLLALAGVAVGAIGMYVALSLAMARMFLR
jgi:hypothetical protein